MLLAIAAQPGVCQLFQQDTRFALEHAVALRHDRVSNSLGDVALIFRLGRGTRRLAPIYPAGSGQVEDEAAICPGIQSEVEIIKTLVNVTE